MDLVQLRTLIHVAELGSLSKAADRLGIAQPALSRQLHKLEEELGGALFVRHSRGMVPTGFARQAIALAHQVFANVNELKSLGQARATAVTGHVHLGMTPTVARVMTAPLAKAVSLAYPAVSLSFTTGFSGHLVDWLRREQIDCCVAYDLDSLGLLHVRPVLNETLFLIGAGNRELSLDNQRSFASLASERLLLPSSLHGLRRIVDRYARQAGITLTPVIEADSFEALLTLVQEGFGTTILPLAALHDRIQSGELCAAMLVDPTPIRHVVMAYPADRTLSSAVSAVGTLFVATAMKLVETGQWLGHGYGR